MIRRSRNRPMTLFQKAGVAAFIGFLAVLGIGVAMLGGRVFGALTMLSGG